MTTAEQTRPFVISDTETLQALLAMQTKVDSLASQVFNASILMEYLIECVNKGAATGKAEDMVLLIEDYQKFYEQRFKDLTSQYNEMLAAKAGVGPTTAGAGPVITLDLNEE